MKKERKFHKDDSAMSQNPRFEKMLSDFKHKVKKEGILQNYKRHSRFVKPSMQRHTEIRNQEHMAKLKKRYPQY